MLQRALQKLPPELREAVILRDLEELEYKEIAELLKVPEGTVRSRLNRGRLELAKSLKSPALKLDAPKRQKGIRELVHAYARQVHQIAGERARLLVGIDRLVPTK